VTEAPALPLAARAAVAVAPPLETRLAPAGHGIGARLAILAMIAAGAFLFVLLGAGLIVYCLRTPPVESEAAQDQSPSSSSQPAGNFQPKPVTLQPVAFVKKGPAQGQDIGSVLQGKPNPDAPPGAVKSVVSGGPPPPANQKQIDAAIDKAVAWLKKNVNGRGRYTGKIHADRLGCSALIGLALLSCGVPADDPAVVAISNLIRVEGQSEGKTYDISCCIWYLDKLGNPADSALIRSLALRLVAGQHASGAWHYQSPVLQQQDENQLLAALNSKEPPAGRMGSYPALQYQSGQALSPHGGDNSNTQFAVLALWAAQKHGVPVAPSLALAEARFRQTQTGDGSWYYASDTKGFKDSMTCAGLVTLAAGQGSRAGRSDKTDGAAPVKDEQIDRGLSYLGKRLGQLKPVPGMQTLTDADGMGMLYLMWSIERVGVLCDLDTIGGHNWYAWGSEILLQWQRADGRWEVSDGAAVDTCFALLFLKRVNVAVDLTKALQGLGGVRDPGGKPVQRQAVALTAEIKVIPTGQPGMAKLRSGYALPADRTGRPRGRRRRRKRQTA
jgi:hypothetical protein